MTALESFLAGLVIGSAAACVVLMFTAQAVARDAVRRAKVVLIPKRKRRPCDV